MRLCFSVTVVCLSLAVLISFPGALLSQEKTVTAEGIAAVTGDDADSMLKARDEAINRAQRRAIEEGVGTLVDSETMVENFQLLDDKIYSHVKGYIKGYEVVEDNKGEGGLYRVKIDATVALASLTKDIKALNIIKERKKNPRIMIIYKEYIDGLEEPGQITQTAMEKKFLSKNFPLVDKAQMEAIKGRDATLAISDLSRAAALGRRFGAEVVIVGEATSSLIDSSRPYGVSVFHYEGQTSGKALDVDTANLLYSESVSTGRVSGGGRVPVAKDALAKAGEMMADKMMKGIVERWRSEVFNVTTVQIIASNATNRLRKNFEKELKGIRGVQSVDERSWTNKILEVDVKVDAAMWSDFASTLENLKTVDVELTGKTQNRIDVRLDEPITAAQ